MWNRHFFPVFAAHLLSWNMDRNEKTASLQKQLHMKDTEQTYFDDKEWSEEQIHPLQPQTEELNNKYAVIVTRCQYLESVVRDLQVQ